jgi:hypothetical protein
MKLSYTIRWLIRFYMKHTSKYRLINILASIAVSIAMFGIGFGHRISVPSDDAALNEYIQSGGLLQDLCGIPMDGETQSGNSCEACRISEAANVTSTTCLPELQDFSGQNIAYVQRAPLWQIFYVHSNNSARGPPVFSLI